MKLHTSLILLFGVILNENHALKCPESISNESCKALKKASEALSNVAKRAEEVKSNSLVDISNDVTLLWSALKGMKNGPVKIGDTVIKLDPSVNVDRFVGDIWMLLTGLDYIKKYTGGIIPKDIIQQAALKMADAFGRYQGEDVRSFQTSLMKVGGPYMPVIRKFISEANFVNRRKDVISKLVDDIGNTMIKIGLKKRWSQIESSLNIHTQAIVKIGAAMENAVFSMDNFFKANDAEQSHSNEFWERLL